MAIRHNGNPAHIAVIEENPLSRSMFQHIFTQISPINIKVAEFSKVADFYQALEALSFSLVLVDVDQLDSIECFAQKVKSFQKHATLAAFNAGPEKNSLHAAVCAGFRCFVSKRSRVEEIILAIKQILDCGVYCDSALLLSIFDLICESLYCKNLNFSLSNLTCREIEVCQYAFQGLTNKRIAELLFISTSTVNNHLVNIYRKLGIKNRAQLIRLKLEQQKTILPDSIASGV